MRNHSFCYSKIKVSNQNRTKQKKKGFLMLNSTSITYQMKREILTFSNKISRKLAKPEKKFIADMVYGMLASESCLLTDITDQLHENTKKVNSVERLTRHLNKGIPATALKSYLSTLRKWVPSEPVIHIDDSDVVKPDGYKFEALGLVRDGSKSTVKKSVYEKGYHVTEACVLTGNGHPVSIFSHIHSSKEKNFTSINDVTFAAMERGAAFFGKATFALDRGYDDNKMFLKLDALNQSYVIRVKSNRKLLLYNKWITASRKNVYLVLVYGITEHPMMLVTNKEIKSRDDVINVAFTYFSRWHIEEYFRCKKQMFRFENFRVRKLKAINALNFYITVCMAFLAHISMKSESHALKVAILQKAAPIKEKVYFCYYRLAKGVSGILSYAKEGVRLWFRTKRPAYRQLCLKLTA